MIKKCDLSKIVGNLITDKGGLKLAEELKNNGTLESITLRIFIVWKIYRKKQIFRGRISEDGRGIKKEQWKNYFGYFKSLK